MRTIALLGILLLALSPIASSQPPSFSQAYQLRAGVGDLATTTAHEPANNWTVEQRFQIVHAAGTADTVTLTIPAGARILALECGCNATTVARADSVTFTIPASTASGNPVIVVATTQTASTALAATFNIPTRDSVAILYLPVGSQADAAKSVGTSLPSTDGSSTIQVYGESGGLDNTFWYAVHPTTSAVGPTTQVAAFPWLWIGVAFAAGAIVWAVLVSRGVVQARSRKQVVATAAHVEAARDESAPVLEGRKRALMAALKEIEVAKMNQEMDAAVYDVVKADFKKQAVTVMRALETGSGESK